MARLIEIQDKQDLPDSLTVKLGDVLLFRATGGYVKSETEVVGLIGHFVSGVFANGELLFPAGTPDTVLFQARKLGRATIDVVTGDPYRAARTTAIEIMVEVS